MSQQIVARQLIGGLIVSVLDIAQRPDVTFGCRVGASTYSQMVVKAIKMNLLLGAVCPKGEMFRCGMDFFLP